MLKKILISILLLFPFIIAQSNPVSPDQAAAVGLNFWKSHATSQSPDVIKLASIIKTYTIAEKNVILYYVFDIAPKGFIIIAGDDAVNPIIGYSFEDFYYADDQSAEFSDWMEQYKQNILDVKQKKTATGQDYSYTWNYYADPDFDFTVKGNVKGVNPLVTTRWDQGTGYNYHCPDHSAGPGGKCYAGCVATAMAQVMKFWNYPEHGVGSNSYYHPYYGTISADFSTVNYAWATMTNTLNANSREAISMLIYHCGVSVNMYYSPLGSSSNTNWSMQALKDHFQYRPAIKFISRNDYTLYDWRAIIMDNLDDGKPVLYSGSGSGGGHEWVCDGYQDTSHFHMNWGWSGANNGYFALDNISDFPNGQEAVVNIIPYFAPYCVPHKIIKDKFRDVGDGSGYSYYWNNTNCDWLIQPDNATKIVLNFTQFKTEAGKDFVSIYDGSSTSANLIGTYSGHDLPPVITSSGGSLFIVFTSDSVNQDLGWEASYLATVTGTDEYDLGSGISVFPNPATDKLNIQSGQFFTEDVKYRIMNITGQLMQSGNISKSCAGAEINIASIPDGIYMLMLAGEKSLYCSKIVIQ